MKYFTKYLPSEGPIGKGDEYKLPGEDAIHTCTESPEGVLSTTIWGSTPQKVSLFLCSREMNKGDSVRQIFADGSISELFQIGNNPITGRVWLNKNGKISHTAHVTTLVNPLAEVSPFALNYVDEDFEGEDGEVMLCSVFWHPKYGYSYEQFWEPGGERRRVVKIKGPCGHFH